MAVYVRKIQVPVRLSQPNLAPRDGSFQLYPTVGSENRPETILELLNSGRNVIPFIAEEPDTVLLLTRTNVDWVAVGVSVESRLVMPPELPMTHEQRVELRFIDESRVDATLSWSERWDVTRLSDYLNAEDWFFPARTGFGTLIANKSRIREMRIIGETIRIPQAPSRVDLDNEPQRRQA